MFNKIILFDLDGVLLESTGYHQSLRASLNQVGEALGISNATLNGNQIARFESLNVTNEWDTIAICTALILLEVWQKDGEVRLVNLQPRSHQFDVASPDYDQFLDQFDSFGSLPAHDAFDAIIEKNPWLTKAQRLYLSEILHQCRNMSRSPTLPIIQETVIGSQAFEALYGLEPQLNIESYLSTHDKPIMTDEQDAKLRDWLSHPEHKAGILTNRPCSAPDGFPFGPEAEIGIKAIGYEQLPFMGSGTLIWYASTKCKGDDHQLLKPNPVHALALLQMCLGVELEPAIEKSISLTNGVGTLSDWSCLAGVNVTIFEDSTKGLTSGIQAKELLSGLGIEINLSLIGVSDNDIKRQALRPIADLLLSNINEFTWDSI